MTFNLYFGDYSMYEPDYGYDYYQLLSDKESYNIGDSMKISFNKGKTLHEKGNYLFLLGQSGIINAEVVDSPTYEKHSM
jgi:hypothetical protein